MPVDKSGLESVKEKVRQGKNLWENFKANNPLSKAGRGGQTVAPKKEIKPIGDYKKRPSYQAAKEANESFKKPPAKTAPKK